jgi:uncharacterized protein (DUF736 family)
MIIGRFQKHESGFSGSIETLGFQVNPVRFVRREKGADYALQGPDNGELGAAWRKTGEWGDYLSVKLDCPSPHAPINATMKLTADTDGFYRLNWQRRRESNGRDE